MAVLSVTEATRLGIDSEGHNVQAIHVDENTITQNATFTTSVAISAAFNDKTRVVRIEVDTNAFIKFAVTPTATTSSILVAAGIPEYFEVGTQSGLKVAAVAQ